MKPESLNPESIISRIQIPEISRDALTKLLTEIAANGGGELTVEQLLEALQSQPPLPSLWDLPVSELHISNFSSGAIRRAFSDFGIVTMRDLFQQLLMAEDLLASLSYQYKEGGQSQLINNEGLLRELVRALFAFAKQTPEIIGSLAGVMAKIWPEVNNLVISPDLYTVGVDSLELENRASNRLEQGRMQSIAHILFFVRIMGRDFHYCYRSMGTGIQTEVFLALLQYAETSEHGEEITAIVSPLLEA